MKYLVTGGFGFLGAPIVAALRTRDASVRVLDDASRGNPERLKAAGGADEVVLGDVRNPSVVRQACRGVDSVIHLASVNGTRHFYERPGLVLDVGVRGMLNVLDGCEAAGVGEIVVASSSEVYQTPLRMPTDESVPLSVPDPRNPRYSYAAAKILTEMLALHAECPRFRRAVVIRPHNVYGPEMGWEHVIPQLTTRLVALRAEAGPEPARLRIQGDGSQTRAFIFIDDFVDAFLHVLDRGEHKGIYHVGTEQEVRIDDLARRIASILGMRIALEPGPEPPGAAPRRAPDTGRLQTLGFRPRVGLDEGLKRTVEWYALRPAPGAIPLGIGKER